MVSFHGRKNFAEDNAYALGHNGTLAEHVFLARMSMEFDNSHSGAFLTAVVLLLHHQIKLSNAIGIGAVFLFVVFQRAAQPNHDNAAFMFERFHPF